MEQEIAGEPVELEKKQEQTEMKKGVGGLGFDLGLYFTSGFLCWWRT